MKQTYFRLGITVTGDKLSTVIDVLNREGADLKVEQIEAPANGAPKAKVVRQKRTMDGKDPLAVVRAFFEGRKGKDTDGADVQSVVEGWGFSPNSCFKPIQAMIGEGVLQRVGRGRYRYTGAAK